MRFQVPQFIEVEDKIFGPLTFKQFVYIGGAVGIAVVIFFVLPTFIALLVAVPVLIFGGALAFYRINDKPFIYVVEAFFTYIMGSKLYIWRKEERKAEPKSDAERTKPIEQIIVPKLSGSKLKDLTWSLDIKENGNPVTRGERESNI